MKKLVISLLLSLVLIAGWQVGYLRAESLPVSEVNQTYSCPDKHHINLEEKAKELGITVDELKAKMKAERQTRLEEKAKSMGITVDELKAKMKAERQTRLEEKAKSMGITVDELKAKMKAGE